jgi:hypothetical protein
MFYITKGDGEGDHSKHAIELENFYRLLFRLKKIYQELLTLCHAQTMLWI